VVRPELVYERLLTFARNDSAGKNLTTLTSLAGSPASGFISSLSNTWRVLNVPKSGNITVLPLATVSQMILSAAFKVASVCAFDCPVSSAVRLIRLVVFIADRVLVISH